jgi:FlaA1/EpsC-like NDP-sugar epimerase
VTHKGKRTLIIGAGNTGEMLIRDMARNGFADYYPIGFLDDDRMKVGTYVHSVKVLGKVARMGDVISQNQVAAVIIAIPSLNHQPLRELYESARKSKVGTIKVVPRIYDFDKPDISLKGLEDISIEDLVGRQVISVDYRGIRNFLEGKSVLVTGAGGSIGMEIVTQVCAFGPRRLVLFEIDETELHNLGLRLGRLFPHLSGVIEYVTGDVRDEGRVREVFGKFRPEIVFHAAAYKHVPMMEHNPREAAKVNVFGTFNIARTAVECGAETFVMISTDKAVRPTSVMGATKRMAEFICRAFGEQREGNSDEVVGNGSQPFRRVEEQRATSNEVVGNGSQPFRFSPEGDTSEEAVGRGPRTRRFSFRTVRGTVPTTGNSPYNGGQPTSQACNSGCRARSPNAPQSGRATTPCTPASGGQSSDVIPAHNLKVTSAGIQENEKTLDSRLRGNDKIKEGQHPFIDGHGEPAEPCALRQAQGDKEGVMVSSSNHAALRPFDELGAGLAQGDKSTKFLSVRFGNVLGSSGSVIPLFQQQIARGGPVTVTHPEITRYFMSIPEAAQLILQAGAMGEGREIFILKMGEPVRIADLAREVIKFHGLEPDTDIEIVFTGLRPGEKLYEELITEGEGIVPTRHEKIMVLQANECGTSDILSAQLDELLHIADTFDIPAIKAKLHEIVPEYTPQ